MAQIEPEPERDEREAILAALVPPSPPQGGEWAARALREGVSADHPASLTEHDVFSLW
ncbi:MAG: hypothetical protein H0T13_02125 [Actinobacteria bacterium]|nr:hypothetical protein [Actinomycetota bacterium]